MKRTLLLGSSLALALVSAGCEAPVVPTTAPNLRPSDAAAQLNVQSSTGGSERFNLSKSSVASAWRVSDAAFSDAARRAINPDDYVCQPPTALVNWLNAEIAKTNIETLITLVFDYSADVVPAYEALWLRSDERFQYFGTWGQFTKAVLKTEKDSKRFWDIPSRDIEVLGIHGAMLLSKRRVAAVYEHAGYSPTVAQQGASDVRSLVLSDPALRFGSHPFFTFDAFAATSFGALFPDKIVLGDGILEGFAALGYDDVAPQAIYAHEFAHHIQFKKGYWDDIVVNPPAVTQAEATRYGELMADAFAAYYLAHRRGANMNKRRVKEFLDMFFQIGDCAFASAGHHGTPNQRRAAAQFGFDVADESDRKGRILKADQFYQLFLAEYPSLIAPDVP